MNPQRPCDFASRPLDANSLQSFVQFQINRVPSLAPYTAMPFYPRIYRPSMVSLPQYFQLDPHPNAGTFRLPMQSLAASSPDLNMIASNSQEPKLQPSASFSNLTLPPLAQSNSVTSDAKKNSKRVHKPSKGVYKCTKCERTYLSYPALYTHIKLKHPILTQAQGSVKSNRGRPRKNVNLISFYNLTIID